MFSRKFGFDCLSNDGIKKVGERVEVLKTIIGLAEVPATAFERMLDCSKESLGSSTPDVKSENDHEDG